MSKTHLFPENYTATPLFASLLQPIFYFHLLSWEVALFKLEISTVQTEKFREEIAFNL